MIVLAAALLAGGIALDVVTRLRGAKNHGSAAERAPHASTTVAQAAEWSGLLACDTRRGRLAQLEERHVHTVEVRRSRRLSPTRESPGQRPKLNRCSRRLSCG